MNTRHDLPSFERPPLVEVVFGIQFEPLRKLASPHLGLLWQEYRQEYPLCRDMPQLTPVKEGDNPAQGGQPRLALLLNESLPRVWFRQNTDNGIIQVQRDRFLHNWKRVKPEDEYPRFPRVRDMFRDRLFVFEQFLERHDLGQVVANQYEITYVNHIHVPNASSVAETVIRTLPDFSWKNLNDRFLPMPSSFNWSASFPLPEDQGRLHATARGGVRKPESTELLVLDLTARGMPSDSSQDSMWKWFELAHEWIVLAFADLTEGEIQRNTWGRIR